MILRVGLLGADDSVGRILDVARGYPEIRIFPVVYQRESEVVGLLERHRQEGEMWLFSGQVPYALAVEWGGLNVPLFYVPHTGAGLYSVLLQLAYDEGIGLDRISFDTIGREDLQRLAREMGFRGSIYMRPYSGAIEAQELVGYHKGLWKAGLTRAAVTCLRSAHVELIQQGVPAVHVVPAHSDIAAVLESMILLERLRRYRASQVAVLALDWRRGTPGRDAGEEASAAGEPDGPMRTQRGLGGTGDEGLRPHLERLARRLSGALQPLGPGRCLIWSTREAVEMLTDELRVQPRLSGVPPFWRGCMAAGIGLGDSAGRAQENARVALGYAREVGRGAWYCAQGNGEVTGPLPPNPEETSEGKMGGVLRVSGWSTEASCQVSLSPVTLGRLSAAVERAKRREVTAQDVAEWLHILPRSARRILRELEDAGLAEVVGEQTPFLRGRPRKVYRLKGPLATVGLGE